MLVEIRDRVVRLDRIRADRLRPHPLNWRTHDDAQRQALRSVVSKIGFAGAVLAVERPEGLLLVDGHLRTEEAGSRELPVLVLDLTDEEVKLLLLSYDPISAMAGIDKANLDELLDHYVGEKEADPEWMAEAETKDLDKMFRRLAKEAGSEWGVTVPIEEPRTPDLPAIAISELGDMWLLGQHRMLCGSATDPAQVRAVIGNTRAEMMFADPPYGVDYDGGHYHWMDPNHNHQRERLSGDDSAAIYAQFMPIAVEFVDGPCYLWFAATLGHEVYSSVHQVEGVISSLIIWHKTNATYSAMRAHYKQRHEVCLYWRPKGSTMRWTGPSDACSLWEIGREAVNKLHPTQKPIELAATAIRNHDAQVVFDPFSGSGTVTMACESLGRQCRAIEVNPTYVDVAIARWRQSSGADPILQATGETFDAVRQRRLAERGLSGA